VIDSRPVALLRHKSDSRTVPLPGDCVVGRSPSAALRIDAPHVSSEHARLRHRGGAWTVRDLGSRNGTWLDGARVPAGVPHALVQGSALSFGDPSQVWILDDTAAPHVLARSSSTGLFRAAQGGLLALPSDESAEVAIFEDGEGRWVAEIEGDPRPIADGAIVEAGGERWTVFLPESGASTCEAEARPLSILGADLRFCVSPDEEQVEITVTAAGRTLHLAPRAHYYLLLTLARERLAAESSAKLLAHERGWIAVDALCRMLSLDETRMNTQVFRVRSDFAELGFIDAATLLERRRGLRTLRLGTPRVSIVSAT
jgi:hypothetical protein